MNTNTLEEIKTVADDGVVTTQNGSFAGGVNTYVSNNAPTETVNVTTDGTSSYTDLTGDQIDIANYVTSKGYMTGTSDTMFNPNSNISRANFVNILYMMDGKPEVEVNNTFDDVSNSSWCASAIAWAKQNNLIAGYGDGTFKPSENITTEQAMAILRNYAEYKGVDTTSDLDLTKYSDAASVSSWATNAYSWAAGNSIYVNDTLNPQAPISKIQVAGMLKAFDEALSNTFLIEPIKDNIDKGNTVVGNNNKDRVIENNIRNGEVVENTAAESKFTDVSEKDRAAVDYVSKRNLLVGTSYTTFNPDDGITRAQIVQILYAMSGSPADVGGHSSFTDIQDGEWYSNAIAWAQNTGLIAGYDDGTFRPNQTISREQAAAILKRYADLSGEDLTTYKVVSNKVDYDSLQGVGDVSNYAKDAVRWAVGDGMIDVSSGVIDPKGEISRAEFANYLMNYDMNYNYASGKGHFNITPIQNPGLNNGVTQTTSVTSTTTTANTVNNDKKSVETVANEVLNGLWDTGDERKRKLEEAGYNYSEVQAAVNKLIAGKDLENENVLKNPVKDFSNNINNHTYGGRYTL